MTTIALPTSFPKFQAIGTNGPLAGYQVFTYLSGTTTLAVTYGSVDGGVVNTNPIILDSLGEATIMLPFNTIYKFVIVNPATSATLTTIDPVYANSEVTAGDFTLSGNLIIKNFSIEDANNNIYINFNSAGSSAVNGLQISNATTGNAPTIAAVGVDSNINLKLLGQGTGKITSPSGFSASLGYQFLDNTGLLDSNGNVILVPSPSASAVNGLGIVNGATGTPVKLMPAGPSSDTNTDLQIVGKGTGLPSVPNGFKLQTVTVTSGGTPTTGMALLATSGTAASFGLVSNINGVTISGTPSVGYVPVATSSTAAIWSAAASSSSTISTNFIANPNFWVWQNNTDGSGAGGTGSASVNASSPGRIMVHDRWTLNTNNTSAGGTIRFSILNPSTSATSFTPNLNAYSLANATLTASATGGVFNLAQSLSTSEVAPINAAIQTLGGTAYLVFSIQVALNAGSATVAPFIYTKTNNQDTDLLSTSGGIAANWTVLTTSANTVTLSSTPQLVYCFASVSTSSNFSNYAVGLRITTASSSDSISVTAAAINVTNSITTTSGVPVAFTSRSLYQELQYSQGFLFTGLSTNLAAHTSIGKQEWPALIGGADGSFIVPASVNTTLSNFNIVVNIPPMVLVPNITFYGAGGTSGQAFNNIRSASCTGTTVYGNKYNNMVINFAGGSTQVGDLIVVNLIADGRPQ